MACTWLPGVYLRRRWNNAGNLHFQLTDFHSTKFAVKFSARQTDDNEQAPHTTSRRTTCRRWKRKTLRIREGSRGPSHLIKVSINRTVILYVASDDASLCFSKQTINFFSVKPSTRQKHRKCFREFLENLKIVLTISESLR